MSRSITTDQALRVTAGVLLALLAWQGRDICARLTRLEMNQTRLFVALGLPPVAGIPSKSWYDLGPCPASAGINEIKPPEDSWKMPEFYP